MAEFIEKACKLCKLCNICSRMKLSARSNLIKRMNSAPSPTTLTLVDSSVKENTYKLPRSPAKIVDGSSKENTFLLPGSPASTRVALEDQDTNSQDSGCLEDPNSDIRFAIPNGFAPRKSIEPSPGKVWLDDVTGSPSGPRLSLSPNTQRSPSSWRSRNSLRSLSFCSTDSFDDGFSELADLDKPDENAPIALANLLTGPLIGGKENGKSNEMATPPTHRPTIRRAFSMVENQIHNPAPTSDGKLAYKRPGELNSGCGLLKKRKACTIVEASTAGRHKLQRSASENAATVLSSTLNNLYGRPELIADFTRPYALPVVPGKHTDLISISVDTLAAVINGDFTGTVRSFTIIDCRYPYEFEGGHIKGAINLYTCEQMEALLSGVTPAPTGASGDPAGRDILIFHCEFSQARGPSMYRLLRRLDRKNSSYYPSLQYPEVYLLHGGYESFFASHGALCEPAGYRPMEDPGYEADLRKFRAKSSSWSVSRTSFKRLHLL